MRESIRRRFFESVRLNNFDDPIDNGLPRSIVSSDQELLSVGLALISFHENHMH